MRRRQTVPTQWLIVRGADDLATAMRLPRDSGVLLVGELNREQVRHLRQRPFVVVKEMAGVAQRVHDMRELRRALLAGTPLIFLSPIHSTASHPDWRPIPRMRAATMARLAKRRLIALGGMDARKFAHIKDLGFQAWAGISAWKPSWESRGVRT